MTQAIASASIAQKDRAAGQGSLFDMMDLGAGPQKNGAVSESARVEPWSQESGSPDEKELLGFYVSGHPLEKWRGVLKRRKFSRLDAIEALEESRRTKDGRGWEGPRYSFGVIIQDVEQRFSRSSGNPFAIVRIEDFTNQAEVMVIGKTYERVHEAGLLRKGAVVELSARVEHDDGGLAPAGCAGCEGTSQTEGLVEEKGHRAADEMASPPRSRRA